MTMILNLIYWVLLNKIRVFFTGLATVAITALVVVNHRKLVQSVSILLFFNSSNRTGLHDWVTMGRGLTVPPPHYWTAKKVDTIENCNILIFSCKPKNIWIIFRMVPWDDNYPHLLDLCWRQNLVLAAGGCGRQECLMRIMRTLRMWEAGVFDEDDEDGENYENYENNENVEHVGGSRNLWLDPYHDDPPHMQTTGWMWEAGWVHDEIQREPDSRSIENADGPTDPSGFHIADHRPLPYQPSNKVCPVKVCAGRELLDFGLIAWLGSLAHGG